MWSIVDYNGEIIATFDIRQIEMADKLHKIEEILASYDGDIDKFVEDFIDGMME